MTKPIEAEIHIPVSKCLACGYQMDMVTDVINEVAIPNAGDISICLNCGNLAIFDETSRLLEPTEEELKDILSDQETTETIIRTVAFIKSRGFLKKEDS